MNTSWDQIRVELGLDKFGEADIHPHVAAERAEFFHSHDCGGTEFEFLNLIHAIVLATKPKWCIETGTFTGLGTLAIAHALHWNNYGCLITLDIENMLDARELIQRYDLGAHVRFEVENASDFIRRYNGEPFEFAFIDSGGERLGETNLLIGGGKLKAGAIVVAHDASPLRHAEPTLGTQLIKECPLPGHTIPFSRGLRIMFA